MLKEEQLRFLGSVEQPSQLLDLLPFGSTLYQMKLWMIIRCTAHVLPFMELNGSRINGYILVPKCIKRNVSLQQNGKIQIISSLFICP